MRARRNQSGSGFAGRIGLAALLLSLSGMGRAQTMPHYPIEQMVLKNGMRVVLSPDHSAPVVGLALAYDVGSRNEVQGRSGFAHLFEHMMFQGSAHVGKFEHARFIGGAGGQMNGFTRPEDTTYVETVPAEKLPLILWLEADRMRSLAVTPENLKNQQDVVKEEKRRSYDNQPYANATLRLRELAFQNYSNQHSTIGSMADLDAASLQDVQSFFKTYYAPNNATLVLAGDFDVKTARNLVQQYFEDIPRQPAPPVPDLTEPVQTAERRDTMSDPLARLPALGIAWRGPSVGTPDSYAMDILGEILFGGETSRCYQELVKKQQLALSVRGGLNAGRGPSLFTVFAVYPGSVQESALEQAIYAQIEALKTTPPTLEEMKRVTTSMAADRYRANRFRGLESMLGRAVEIADYTVFQNDPNLVNTEMDRYRAVTPAQVQEAAQKYFLPAARTVLEVQAGSRSGLQGGAK